MVIHYFISNKDGGTEVRQDKIETDNNFIYIIYKVYMLIHYFIPKKDGGTEVRQDKIETDNNFIYSK